MQVLRANASAWFATVSERARPTHVMSRSHSSQMFCPTGRPPVLLSGASGRATGAATCRSPLAGAGAQPVPAPAPALPTSTPHQFGLLLILILDSVLVKLMLMFSQLFARTSNVYNNNKLLEFVELLILIQNKRSMCVRKADVNV